ncbi:MAG: fused MFS/spermidine synthase [Anaerolineae bacterium]
MPVPSAPSAPAPASVRLRPAQLAVLRALVLVAGMASLGIEMAASRLLAPYFGTSLLIWANIIGLMLVYLALGYWLGGRLADRRPDPPRLYGIAALAGALTALVPIAAGPVLRASQQSFFDASVGLFVGSLLGTLALFSLPVILLGMVTPFAARLALRDVASAGRDVGSLYALSTVGSIVGVFAAALVLVPLVGTRATFLTFAAALLLAALAGLLAHRRRRAALAAAAGLAGVALLALVGPSTVRPGASVLYETETLYNYVQVLQTGDDRWLALNEGQALHSWYRPGALLSGGIWDDFLLAPLFAPDPLAPPRHVAIIGMAAGTVARQYAAVYPDAQIVGVEIDGALLDIGRRYFALDEANARTVAADGRAWLQGDGGRYDVIAVDAYRQPYIPFHLATREFFGLARERLTENGVLVVNVGHGPGDDRLVAAIADTLRAVFLSVYVVSPDGSFNSLLVATRRPTSPTDYATHADAAQNAAVRAVAASVAGRVTPWPGRGAALTDDRAPVEWLTDAMILRYVFTGQRQD